MAENLSRRHFLRGSAVASASLVAAMTPVGAEPASLSPHERVAAALRELEASMEAFQADNSSDGRWHVFLAKRSNGCPVRQCCYGVEGKLLDIVDADGNLVEEARS